jgi:hypothetical protein
VRAAVLAGLLASASAGCGENPPPPEATPEQKEQQRKEAQDNSLKERRNK